MEQAAARRRSLRTLVDIAVEDPRHSDVVRCFARYANELDAKFVDKTLS